MDLSTIELIAWDFDGVLNRNIVNGEFIWSRHLERDWGVPVAGFQEWFFGSGRFQPLLTGQIDFLELLNEWIADHGHEIEAEAFMAYWFESDDLPDPDMVALTGTLPQRQVIATNNEARRAAYISGPAGWGARVDGIFAAGPMGVAKPDQGFFDIIENWAGVDAGRILLVDDSRANVEAALSRGWQAFFFTEETRKDFLAGLSFR